MSAKRTVSARRTGAQFAGGLGVVLAALVAVAGCGTQTDQGRPAAGAAHADALSARTPARVPAALRVSATLPAAFGTPTFLAGDPAGAGVWAWNSTGNSQVAIVHEDGQGRLRSWPLLTGAANTGPHGTSGFAVSGRSVWVGINSTVAELDSRTGQVRTWHIPATRPLPRVYRAGARPGVPRIPAAVQALAVSPDGRVAVAMSQSSAVEVLDPASGTWQQVVLPATDDEPISVGFSSAGLLGVGFANRVTHLPNGFLIAKGSTRVTATVRDAWEVTPYRHGGFLVGATRPDVVSAGGSAAPLMAPGVLLDPTGPAEPPVSLPGGQLAFITKAGVTRFPAGAATSADATAAALTLALPRVSCASLLAGMTIAPGSNVHRPRAGSMCDVPIYLMAIDGAGNTWVMTANHQNAISLLAP